MTIYAIVNRIMHRHAPPEQPHTGRVCVKCRETIGKHDRYRIRVAEHVDCLDPRGINRTEPLDTLLDRGAL